MEPRGRSCPPSYRYQPEALAQPAQLEADTLYVVGGLYGNPVALRAILERADGEPGGAPAIVFNGDFHWLDVDPEDFQTISEAVLARHATKGNVEAELAADEDRGCGCAYPDYVGDDVVDRSNQIMTRLRATAARFPELVGRLGALPRLPHGPGGRHAALRRLCRYGSASTSGGRGSWPSGRLAAPATVRTSPASLAAPTCAWTRRHAVACGSRPASLPIGVHDGVGGGGKGGQTVWVDLVAAGGPGVLDGDEAHLGQHLEVMGDRRLAHADLLDDLADGHRPVGGGEQVQDLGAGGVGQAVEPLA
jgi:hypothetical protein